MSPLTKLLRMPLGTQTLSHRDVKRNLMQKCGIIFINNAQLKDVSTYSESALNVSFLLPLDLVQILLWELVEMFLYIILANETKHKQSCKGVGSDKNYQKI